MCYLTFKFCILKWIILRPSISHITRSVHESHALNCLWPRYVFGHVNAGICFLGPLWLKQIIKTPCCTRYLSLGPLDWKSPAYTICPLSYCLVKYCKQKTSYPEDPGSNLWCRSAFWVLPYTDWYYLSYTFNTALWQPSMLFFPHFLSSWAIQHMSMS